MKHNIIILLCVSSIILGGCAKKIQEQSIKEESIETKSELTVNEPIETESELTVDEPTETEFEYIVDESFETESKLTVDEPADMEHIVEDTDMEKSTTYESSPDDIVYIGEYLDVNDSSELEIAKGGDSKYIVQIGIFRLTSLDDGVGELTEDGMVFTATDAAGNSISGLISVENQTATIIFTDSTWEYLPNGSTYEFTKSSDIPNIWGVY